MTDHLAIVFDGHCVLCWANARFVLRNDRRGHFRLAAMQGEAGAAILERCGVDPADTDPLIVVDKATDVSGGARDADEVLTLADHAPSFADLAISQVRSKGLLPPPLYARVMGDHFKR